MSIEEIVEKELEKCKAFYLKVKTTEEDTWYFYVITERECDSIWMDFLYGFHFYQIDKKGRQRDVYAVNIKSCYENGVYDIGCLVDTALHEYLHKFTPNERLVYNSVSELLKGYKFGRIKI